MDLDKLMTYFENEMNARLGAMSIELLVWVAEKIRMCGRELANSAGDNVFPLDPFHYEKSICNKYKQLFDFLCEGEKDFKCLNGWKGSEHFHQIYEAHSQNVIRDAINVFGLHVSESELKAKLQSMIYKHKSFFWDIMLEERLIEKLKQFMRINFGRK